MKELTEHEVHLNSARINLQGCLRIIEEMLHSKGYVPEERNTELTQIINQCNWAVTYLFRAQEELKLKS